MARLDLARTAFWVTACSALAAVGCSDPPEPSAYAGLTVRLDNPSNTSLGFCQATGSIDVGEPPPSAATTFAPGSAPDLGRPTLSGRGGVTASCSVTGSSPYSVRAAISRDDFDFKLWGSIASDGASDVEASLTAVVQDRNLYSNECTVTPLDVGRGEFFVQFHCDNAKQTSEPGIACSFRGTVAMLRCAQE